MRWIWAGLVASALSVSAGAQSWVVRPEWVKAHEEFLASDVMAGRGSATRDEEIAATYVASEFEGYGLKMAPGMTAYMQSAAIVSPVLDGKATLMVGSVVLHEGVDFTLLQAAGTEVGGPLKETAGGKVEAGAYKGVVLLVDVPAGKAAMEMANGVRRAGANVVVVPEDESTRTVMTMMSGKTRTPIGLAEGGRPRVAGNLVVATAAGFARLHGAVGGEAVLAVHAVPAAGERRTYNAVGWLPGTDAGAGVILLTAHLDHLGVGKPVNGDGIYNGANDDASGTTAVLELAHALATGPRLRRGVLFVCYGSEELGGLGSTYFGAHPPVPLKELVANLEFEMIGTQDPKMPKGVLLLTGWERSNLGPELKKHGALLGPDPYPEQHFFERSDNYSLALLGVVAHTAAGWGTPPTYHQPSDDLAHLDIGFMTAAIQSLVEPVRWLAGSDFKPQWNAGGQPGK